MKKNFNAVLRWRTTPIISPVLGALVINLFELMLALLVTFLYEALTLTSAEKLAWNIPYIFAGFFLINTLLVFIFLYTSQDEKTIERKVEVELK